MACFTHHVRSPSLTVSALTAQRGHGANLAGIHTTHMPACCLSSPSPNTHNCPRPPLLTHSMLGLYKAHSAAVPGLCTVLQDCCPLPCRTPSTLLSCKKKAMVTCPLNTPQLLALYSSCCLSICWNVYRWFKALKYYVSYHSKDILECNSFTAGTSWEEPQDVWWDWIIYSIRYCERQTFCMML